MKPRVKSEPSLKYTLLQDLYGKVLIMMSHPSEHLRIEDERTWILKLDKYKKDVRRGWSGAKLTRLPCLQGLSRVEIDRTGRS